MIVEAIVSYCNLSHYFIFCHCPGFGQGRVNFLPSSCCGLDLAGEECG